MREEMTREQACNTLRNAAWLGTNEDRERIEKAVELLCGELCEDAISRDAVLALPRNKVRDFKTMEVVCETINVTDIETLPPVTPKQRTGHWIECEDEVKCFCSECKEISDYPTKFCPNCGAKMIEPQESEEQS